MDISRLYTKKCQFRTNWQSCSDECFFIDIQYNLYNLSNLHIIQWAYLVSIHIQYTHKKLTVAYVDCVTWFNIWGARIGSTFQGNLEEWCIKFLFSLCTTCKRRRKKNEMSGLLNCCFMTGFKSIKLFTGTDNDMQDVPKLKVSKSWKQFMASSILPRKNEQNSLS